MEKLVREKAIQVIRGFRGKLFVANFTKKDGSKRKMVCRTGVSKGIKGTGTYSHTRDLSRSNITVYEFANGGQYRVIPLDRLHTIKCGKYEFEVI